MKESNYIKISEDGSVSHIHQYEEQREISDEFLEQLGAKSKKTILGAFLNEGDSVNLVASGPEVYAWKFLRHLNISTQYKIGKNKILTPVFLPPADKPGAADHLPAFVGRWVPPFSMRLMYAARIYELGSGRPHTSYNHGCFLIAWDEGGRAFRLPLPNLFDNCDMCTGQFNGSGDSIQEAFSKACEQMSRSEWNSDLLDNSRLVGSEKMFRFEPGEGADMVSVPFTEDWKKLCPKVANATIDILKP